MANLGMTKIILYADDQYEVVMIDATDGVREKRFLLRDYPDYDTMVAAGFAWLDEGVRRDFDVVITIGVFKIASQVDYVERPFNLVWRELRSRYQLTIPKR